MLCVLKLVAMWLARWEEQNTLEASPGGDGIMAFKTETALWLSRGVQLCPMRNWHSYRVLDAETEIR